MSNVWDIIEKDPRIAEQYVNTATSVSRTKAKKSPKDAPVTEKNLKKKELQKIEHKKETLYKLLEDLQRESVNLKKSKTVTTKARPATKAPVKPKKTKKVTKVPQVLPIVPKNTETTPTKIPDYIASNIPITSQAPLIEVKLDKITPVERVQENMGVQRLSIASNQIPEAKNDSKIEYLNPRVSVSSKRLSSCNSTINEQDQIHSPVPTPVFKTMFARESSVVGE
ncbi:hypothetical protein HDV04_000652 [Boothiomyces sp. JEL0838]|nr:hypothetical protein HDV04_000652 [Boothiomyces sp. JEL0838]